TRFRLRVRATAEARVRVSDGWKRAADDRRSLLLDDAADDVSRGGYERNGCGSRRVTRVVRLLLRLAPECLCL
uniref:Uncharacterized protein n=1 Tax=Cucumis melo TaxID=3656 RepID=A0A9I9EHW3_CUCME